VSDDNVVSLSGARVDPDAEPTRTIVVRTSDGIVKEHRNPKKSSYVVLREIGLPMYEVVEKTVLGDVKFQYPMMSVQCIEERTIPQ